MTDDEIRKRVRSRFADGMLPPHISTGPGTVGAFRGRAPCAVIASRGFGTASLHSMTAVARSGWRRRTGAAERSRWGGKTDAGRNEEQRLGDERGARFEL